MPKFGSRSLSRLTSCDERLQCVLNEVINHVDCSVLSGYRGEKEQNRLKLEGKSQLSYPHSKHNTMPSVAVDVAPYPIDWNDLNRFRRFAGFVEGVAAAQGVKLRWGGDWDRDWDMKDNRFNDLPHFELVED